MKQKTETPKIELRTLPNGYSLDIEHDQYLYFDRQSLLEGFIYHVGLSKPSYVEPGKIQSLIQAMETWPNATDAQLEMADLQVTAGNLRTKNEHMGQRLSIVSRSLEKAQEQIKQLTRERDAALTHAKRLDNELKKANKRQQPATTKHSRTIVIDTDDDQQPNILYGMSAAPLPESSAAPSPSGASGAPSPTPPTHPIHPIPRTTPTKNRPGRPKAPAPSPSELSARREAEHNATHRVKRRERLRAEAEALLAAKRIEYSDDIYRALITPLSETGISLALLTRLDLDGTARTVGDIAIHPRTDFIRKRGCGKLSISTFEEWMTAHGLAYGMDVQGILMEHFKRRQNGKTD